MAWDNFDLAIIANNFMEGDDDRWLSIYKKASPVPPTQRAPRALEDPRAPQGFPEPSRALAPQGPSGANIWLTNRICGEK